MAESPYASQLPSETSHQDSEEQPSEQSDPCVEQKDPVEVDESKGPGRPAKPIAYVSPMSCEPTEPTEPAEAAEHHAGRRNSQEQTAHSGRRRRRRRRRTEIGSHSQAAFQEWQGPSQGLVPQTYFNQSERPHLALSTGADVRMYPIFIPTGPTPVEIAQRSPMVYWYWVFMKPQVLATYPYAGFIPMANIVPYFMLFSPSMYFTYFPW